MPRGDGTGPRGMGPMTGRAAGFCAGYGVPGFANPAPGFGAGMGYGARGGRGGRGWRNMYYATGLPGWARAGYAPAAFPGAAPVAAAPNPETQLNYLNSQAEQLKAALEDIQSRIADLEKTGSGGSDQ